MLGAVDIGGSKIAVAAVHGEGRIIVSRTCPTAPAEGPEAGLDRIVRMLRDCAREINEPVTGIGIGCTGSIDPLDGVLGSVDLLPGWSGFPLVARLREEFQVEAAMENDADAAAMAESAWGAGRTASRFLYITVGTGIGTGFIVDGYPYRGAGGSHPEAGHHTVDPCGPECYCGARGCWESLASGPAMAAWTHLSATTGDELPADADAAGICRLARAGHALARKAVVRESHYLGLGLANLINVLCPDRVAFGGGVMRSADLLLPTAIGTAVGLCTLVPVNPASISVAQLGADAALLGAAHVWLSRFAQSSKAFS